jgi:trimeric autotransporter adhesin
MRRTLLFVVFSLTALAAETAGPFVIADTFSGRVRAVTSGTITGPSAFTGVISTAAGNGGYGFSGDGGAATSATLNNIQGLAEDNSGNIYVADTNNRRIRKFTIGGTVTTVAGGGTVFGDGGPAINAGLNYPTGVCVDSAGNFYIVDTGSSRIRKVTVGTGTITTVAGNGLPGSGGDGGLATNASLNGPRACAVDSAGNLYIAGTYGNRVRKVTAQ